MSRLAIALTALVVATAPCAAHAFSCDGSLIDVGDEQAALLKKCGRPLRVDGVCVPRPSMRGWVYDPSLQVAQPLVTLECVPAEDWSYDRGPGNFLAIVRVRDGVVESIRDGDKAR